MSDLRLILFGSPKLERDGQPIRLDTRKGMALLIYLAMNAQGENRETLSALLWPEQNERRARASLRQALSSLRQRLGADLLLTGGAHVSLRDNPGLYVDVLTYRQLTDPCCSQSESLDDLAPCIEPLTQAVGLYTGDFLAGFSLPDCPEFDEWQFFQAESLRRSLAQALQILIRWYTAGQDYEPAIDYARRWLALDRLHEAAQRQLMELYALTGQQAAAVRQYEECVRILDEELAVSPEGETVALYEAIRSRRLAPPAVTAGDQPNNLPPQPTPFVGREEELSDILTRLQDPDCRLLTLVGPGGMGKTRLAIESVQRLLDRSPAENGYAHGIFFVPLQPVNEVNDIVSAIAEAVGFHFYSEKPPREQLLDYLRRKHILLVLDTFEHLLAGVDLVAQILTAAPDVKILVTSREGLRLRQEWFHPLTGMRFSGDPAAGEQDVSDYDAVRLFVQNARRAQSRFLLAEEKDHVMRICRLVDGMPLGIELAAAWLKVLSCAQIANEIERGLDILTARHQDVPERHRSMRNLLEQSWRWLPEDEQDALGRLSVFQGGFSCDAAEEVAGTSLLTLATLVEKSLLQVHPEGPRRGRYQMHELLRQFSVEKLGEQEDKEQEARDRHADYYCNYLNQHHEGLKRSRQQNSLKALNMERRNLQIAWERAATQRNLDQIVRAIDGLGRFYEWAGNLAGSAAAFSLIGDNPDYLANRELNQVQAHALAWAANYELLSGRKDVAEEQLTRSMAILNDLAAAGVNTRWQKALALLHWGHLERPRNLEAAVRAYSRSSEYYDEMGRRWEAATARAWLGETEREIGHIDEAVNLLRRAQDVFEEFGDQHSVAMVLEKIARAYLLDQADLEIALETAQASLELRRRSGDRVGIASTLLVLSYVYCWLNQPADAEPLMAEALAIAQDLGHRAGECEAYYIAMVIYNYLEDREKKAETGARGLALARELGDVRLMSNFLRSLGTQALIRGDYEDAHNMHVEAFDVQEQAGIQVMLPWLHVVRSYSSWKVGSMDEARHHIAYALRVSVERSDYYTVVHALLFMAQIVAIQGDLERAVEIGATARASSRWETSLTGRTAFVEPLERLTRGLSPEIAAAARERGRTCDLFETAAQLHQEVQQGLWLCQGRR